MSRIDPNVLYQFNIPDRQQQDLAIAQKQAVIAEQKAATEDHLAQAEERRRQADNLTMQMQERRRAYNAKQAVQGYLGTHRGAAYGQPELDMQELLSVGGPDAIPFVKDFLDQQKEAIAQTKSNQENFAAKMKWIGETALDLKSLPPEQRPAAHQQKVQFGLQNGFLTQAEANQMLASHDTDEELDQIIAGTPAFQTKITRDQAALTAQEEQNLKHQQALHAAAQAEQAQAEIKRKQLENARIEQGLPPVPPAPKQPVPGVDVPFSPDVEAQKTRMATAQAAARRAAQGSTNDDDIREVANGIVDGTLPPDTPLYRNGIPVQAEIHRQGYNLATAKQDYKAVQKHLATLNGAQQERLRQAAQFVDETIPQIETAYAEWKKQAGVSGFKIINKATLATMANMPGPAGSAATQLLALIGDFTSELGTVYKGGNSSTDESLQLAAKNLQGDWNEQTFKDAITRLKTSMKIRRNSYMTSQAVGVSPGSPYVQPSGGGGAAPAPAPAAGEPRRIRIN